MDPLLRGRTMDLYFVLSPAGPVLCKYRYLVEHGLEGQPHRYRAFLDPNAQHSATQFLESAVPDLSPAAEVQISELVLGPYDHRVLTVR